MIAIINNRATTSNGKKKEASMQQQTHITRGKRVPRVSMSCSFGRRYEGEGRKTSTTTTTTIGKRRHIHLHWNAMEHIAMKDSLHDSFVAGTKYTVHHTTQTPRHWLLCMCTNHLALKQTLVRTNSHTRNRQM